MLRKIGWLLLSASLAGVGCSRMLNPDDSDRDSDSDSNTGTDDPDTDPDSDTTVADLVDCNATYTTPAPGSLADFPSCYTAELECNMLVEATTDGGSDEIDDYTQWSCARDIDLSGPERVYHFVQEIGTSVEIRLYDGCGDMRLIEFLNGNSSDDEIASNSLCGGYADTKNCDVGTGRIDYQELVYPPFTSDRHLELIVDSQPGTDGNYIIEVICD